MPFRSLTEKRTSDSIDTPPLAQGEANDLDDLIPDRKLEKKYNYDDYCNGDIYDGPKPTYTKEWELDESSLNERPYLKHIKSLSKAWPHLHYLAEWMEVSTSPTKWQLIRGLAHQDLKKLRDSRASRTKVAVVDFVSVQKTPDVKHIIDPGRLAECLNETATPNATRLYIVEDLSRDVIEHLGSKLDIDPQFFREHINDYTWFNVRDPWVELPDLNIVSRTRPYFRLTYMQPRYFKSQASFQEAQKQAGRFNVLRRLDEDNEHSSLFDDSDAVVALVRSKASLWIRSARENQQAVGVLLIDPSITEGFPLWKGYRPFKNSPCPSEGLPEGFKEPNRASLYEELLFWIRQTSQEDIDSIEKNPKAMAFRILEIICAEWLTLSRYITARLGQIEWEIEKPEVFQGKRVDIQRESMNFKSSLTKLHTWRRRLPVYRSMVADMRTKLFPDPLNSTNPSDPPNDCIAALREDFTIVARHIDDLLSRTERIAAVATAVTAIEESRRALEQNKTLGRLTYLAVIFAPLSFVSSFFSMSANLADLTQTIWVYFCVAIPISALVYLLVDKNWTNNLQGAYDTAGKAKKKTGGFLSHKQ
ncbi:hypothetical protein F5Y04DRAFT_241833 [Hypomontagnella monticulosa]|nr:hypothetical protein F5Y04DRAFT_241833 [Hypomontagnella monticulosa]